MLHPQARALLDLMIRNGVPPMYTLSPVEARKNYLVRGALTQLPAPEVGLVQDLHAEGPEGPLPLRLYRPLGSPKEARLAALVYFHGGGWTIGGLDTHDTLCRDLANGSGCAVVAVDYRLAPEARFPAAVLDCEAATRWVSRNADSLGIDASAIGVGGDSAGGNLAAVVALLARDSGDLPLAFQLLIYPSTDQRCLAPSHQSNGQGYLLTREAIQYYHDNYIDDPRHDLDFRASPLLHSSHANLPPAFILTAGYDPLRDEGLLYAQALSNARTPSSYVCFERQIHGFVPMGKVLDEATTAVALCAAATRKALVPRSLLLGGPGVS